jgi:hypothetical protein
LYQCRQTLDKCSAVSQEELPHHAAMSEVAIHISNHTIHKRDRGLVVVGASSRLGELGDGFGAPRPSAFRVSGLEVWGLDAGF